MFIAIVPLIYLLNPGILYAYPAMLKLNPLVVRKVKFKLAENRNYIVLEHLDRSIIYTNYFEKLSEKIMNYVIEKQLYLDPLFDVDKLSHLLSVPSQHIHFCVKYDYGTTCMKMMNSMRINYFITQWNLIADKTDIDFQTLALQSGFTRYKVFLKEFKRYQGVSFADWYAENI